MMPERLLIVDDALLQRELLARRLAEAGYEVRVAANLQQARRIVSVFRPKLVLIELVRIDDNGFSVAAALARSGDVIPVLMSARRQVADRHWAAVRGIPRVLDSHCETSALLSALQDMLAQTRQERGQ